MNNKQYLHGYKFCKATISIQTHAHISLTDETMSMLSTFRPSLLVPTLIPYNNFLLVQIHQLLKLHPGYLATFPQPNQPKVDLWFQISQLGCVPSDKVDTQRRLPSTAVAIIIIIIIVLIVQHETVPQGKKLLFLGTQCGIFFQPLLAIGRLPTVGRFVIGIAIVLSLFQGNVGTGMQKDVLGICQPSGLVVLVTQCGQYSIMVVVVAAASGKKLKIKGERVGVESSQVALERIEFRAMLGVAFPSTKGTCVTFLIVVVCSEFDGQDLIEFGILCWILLIFDVIFRRYVDSDAQISQ
jgi:hypothetical protein